MALNFYFITIFFTFSHYIPYCLVHMLHARKYKKQLSDLKIKLLVIEIDYELSKSQVDR